MRKHTDIAIAYASAALAFGVYYRELTRIMGFTGITMLSKVHPHLFMLGMAVFLFASLFSERRAIEKTRTYRPFMICYNIGLLLTALMMALRGTLEVTGYAFTKALDASISGIAGIGHILLGAGMILFLAAIRNSKER
ncbi:MAG: DUF2871 family protein [Candidatus Ornithospirochaeta sp.]|nr:DUF2871 family protein [Candidatus Ornithospirochaeta sp.]